MEVVEITEDEVWIAAKRMKTGSAPFIDEVHTEMIVLRKKSE